jgi:hypothetical protein
VESVAILVLHQGVIGIQSAALAASDVQAVPIVELAIVLFLVLAAVIV